MVEPILDETVDVIVPFQRVEHKLGTYKIISGFDEERSKFKMIFFLSFLNIRILLDAILTR